MRMSVLDWADSFGNLRGALDELKAFVGPAFNCSEQRLSAGVRFAVPGISPTISRMRLRKHPFQRWPLPPDCAGPSKNVSCAQRTIWDWITARRFHCMAGIATSALSWQQRHSCQSSWLIREKRFFKNRPKRVHACRRSPPHQTPSALYGNIRNPKTHLPSAANHNL